MTATKELSPRELADVLASGRYRKTRGALMDSHGYCCLGVYAREVGILQEDDRGDGFVIDDSNDLHDDGRLYGALGIWGPPWMQRLVPQEEVGRPPGGFPKKVMNILADINDGHDTFEPVIEYLRKL